MAWNRADVVKALAEVEVENLQHSSGLQVFGLKWFSPIGVDYMTLDEAVRAKFLDVAEVNEGGRVSTIKVFNKSDRLVFLMAGELLVGCKQDRVINTSIMVPTKGQLCIPATCVEAGRWSYRTRKFSSGGTSSHGLLRMMMSRLEEVLAKLSAPAGCHGAAFVIDGKIVAVDLFDKPSTLNKLWSKLIRSYAIDALEAPTQKPTVVQPEQISEWVKTAVAAEQKWFHSPGVGYDVRIEGERLVGAALVVEEHPVHLELFREEPPAPELGSA